MLCSECDANLPEEAQFCLKCGEPVPSIAHGAATSTAPAPACPGCGAHLTEGAQFCQCGRRVRDRVIPIKDFRTVTPKPLPDIRRRSRARQRWAMLVLLLLLAGVTIWTAVSDNPGAQQVQEFVGWKRDQTVLDSPVTLSPGTFQYYKFSLPEGSVNVAVVGDFSSTVDNHAGGNHRKNDNKKRNQNRSDGKDQDQDNSKNIEIYVLTDSAFTVWQNGYTTGSLYESGRISEGKFSAELPAGAGVYYLVFNNKFAANTEKAVRATVLLRYKSWLPELMRTTKARVWNWVDF